MLGIFRGDAEETLPEKDSGYQSALRACWSRAWVVGPGEVGPVENSGSDWTLSDSLRACEGSI